MYFQLPIGNVFSSPESIIFLHVKEASLVFGCIWSVFGNAEVTSHIIFMDMNKITEKQWSVTGLCLKKILIGHRRGNIAYFKNRRSRCSVKNSVCSIVISSLGDFSEVETSFYGLFIHRTFFFFEDGGWYLLCFIRG